VTKTLVATPDPEEPNLPAARDFTLSTFDFHGHPAAVLTDQRGHWVFPGQLSAFMGVDGNNQRKRIMRNHWSEGWAATMAVRLPGDDRTREHFMLHQRRLATWLGSITTSNIKNAAVRVEVERHQTEFADALADYLTKGLAINPRVEKPMTELELAHRYIAALEREQTLVAANGQLAEQVAEMAPKAEGYDDLIAADGYLDLAATAKVLSHVTGGLGRNRFISLLRGMSVLTQSSPPLPYQHLLDRGYFAVRTELTPAGARPYTVVTPKGLRWLHAELREDRPTLGHGDGPPALPGD
jgi:phage antirepressor YoqD-like protein